MNKDIAQILNLLSIFVKMTTNFDWIRILSGKLMTIAFKKMLLNLTNYIFIVENIFLNLCLSLIVLSIWMLFRYSDIYLDIWDTINIIHIHALFLDEADTNIHFHQNTDVDLNDEWIIYICLHP